MAKQKSIFSKLLMTGKHLKAAGYKKKARRSYLENYLKRLGVTK